MALEITTKLVKQLCEKTGVNMMNCKTALEEKNEGFVKAFNSL